MSNLTQDVTVYFISLLSGAPPLSASGNVFHYEVIVKDKTVGLCSLSVETSHSFLGSMGTLYLAIKVAAATLNI